jgi:polysaccharide biosynthesis protein PslA
MLMDGSNADIVAPGVPALSMRSVAQRVLPKAGGEFELTQASGLPITWRDGQPDCAPLSSIATHQWKAKRLLDVLLALVALFILLPLLLLVVAAIKLTDGGPVFFRQERIGRNGELFQILKFRSMRVDSCDASGVTQTVAGDKRVTGVGAFIRRTSIDELPQLINILRGEMSVVGPRPHVPGMQAAGQDYEKLVPYYGFRNLVAPGLTGWAQANGFRGETSKLISAVKRVEHDVAYIQNFSLLLDLRIILLTIRREFLSGSGV